MFHPSTVEIQGVPGRSLRARPQIRLSKTIKSDVIDVEIAAPPAVRCSVTPRSRRNAGHPAGVQQLEGRSHTMGSAGSAVDAASDRLLAVGRYFKVPNFAPAPTSTVTHQRLRLLGRRAHPDRPRHERHDPDNALTFTGSFVYGQAIADSTRAPGRRLVRGRTGNAMGMPQAYPRTWTTDTSPSRSDGVLHAIRWGRRSRASSTTCPTANRMFIAANYSHMHSSDISALGATNPKLFDKSDWVDANLFVDANAARSLRPRVRLLPPELPGWLDREEQPIQFSALYIF